LPLLNVALVPGPDQTVVRLTGEVDLSSAGLLADALEQAGRLDAESVVVDAAQVRFWDCSGLHALADFTAELSRAGRRCRIVGATAATRRLIVLADFAPALVLDGPVHLPAVTPGATTPRPEPTGAISDRRRSPVPRHPAPARRRVDLSTPRPRGGLPALRRWA
jgi:anti-anti-sigma factor